MPPQGYGLWHKMVFEAMERLKKAAEASGHTLPQLALAWLLINPTVSSVISGFSSAKQLKENLSALEVKLSEDELAACIEVNKMLHPGPKMFHPTCVEAERTPVKP